MGDLIERLRHYAGAGTDGRARFPMPAGERVLMESAADEIERLRRAAAAVVAIRPSNWDDDEDPEQRAAWLALDAALAGQAQAPLPADAGGCVTKWFVIFTTPGRIPEKKGGWLKDEHLIDFLREVMLHDGWPPGFRATVLQLTWDNDLWASSAGEYLAEHDAAIGRRRARMAWQQAREKHQRIYHREPVMRLGAEIESFWKLTAIPTPAGDAPVACRFCKGEGWEPDQNWEPRYPDVPQERERGDGLIRCGWCLGDGIDPAPATTAKRQQLRALIDTITNDVLPRAKSETYLSVKARAQMQVAIADRILAALQTPAEAATHG